jgi:hypothetical protein
VRFRQRIANSVWFAHGAKRQVCVGPWRPPSQLSVPTSIAPKLEIETMLYPIAGYAARGRKIGSMKYRRSIAGGTRVLGQAQRGPDQ